MISLNQLTSLANVLKTVDAKTAKTLIKLVSVDVLKSLGDDKFLIKLDNKELIAQSQKQLQENSKYFARFQSHKQNLPTLSNLTKIPKLLSHMSILKNTELVYDIKTLTTILSSKKALNNFKETILKELQNSPNKEHFHTVSNLLLALNQNILNFPFIFYEYLGFLQLKKRYNKKTKKSFIDFYAIFENLGAISGLISEDIIKINVMYEEIKEFLEDNLDEISYDVKISVVEDIKPLYDINTNNNLLDIVT